VVEEASDAVGWRVMDLCERGPAERLRRTENTQIAVHVINLAYGAAIGELPLDPVAVAGHSVGEISALTHAGSLTVSASTRLVAERGRLMASIQSAGGLLSVVGMSRRELGEVVDELRRSHGVLEIAADNAPGHAVVAGTDADLDRLMDFLGQRRGVRTLRLETSGAFHSRIFESLRPEWSSAVASVELRTPRLTVVSSVTGGVVSNVDEIRRALVSQLTSAVRWREAVLAISRLGAACVIESGEGATVSRLAMRTMRRAMTNCSAVWQRRSTQPRPVASL
jgi:[acyl-carrier-protein] S-malonyltransferase